MLQILNFIGKLALRESYDTILMDLLRMNNDHFVDWVWVFIHQVGQDHTLVNRAQQKFNIQLSALQYRTIQQYREILGQADDGQQLYAGDSQAASQA